MKEEVDIKKKIKMVKYLSIISVICGLILSTMFGFVFNHFSHFYFKCISIIIILLYDYLLLKLIISGINLVYILGRYKD